MMERLTEKQSSGFDLKAMNGEWCNKYCEQQRVETCNECVIYQAIQTLAEYEDLEELIGIPLKDITEIFRQNIPEDCKHPRKAIVLTDDDVYRWNGYKNAEEQGLLLRLPCKVGDTVYAICTCEAVGTVLDGTLYGSNGGFGTATGYYCPYELSDKCPHTEADDCEECKNIENVFEDTVDYINITECEILIGLKNTNLCVTVDEIGKTVFFTQAEAEQKLSEMESDLHVKH